MQTYFNKCADSIQQEIQGNETFQTYLSGENSNFTRFNNNKIRQSGHVTQMILDIELISGQKHSSHEIPISKNWEQDYAKIKKSILDLRERLKILPDDPHLMYSKENNSTEQLDKTKPLNVEKVISEITNEAKASDLVGILASGPIYAGFANSFGQRNWFEKFNFNFDWSLYHKKDKAVKSGYAGFEWDSKVFIDKMNKAKEELKHISKEPKTINPGKYRVYMSPSALNEFMFVLAWGGFSLKAQKTKNSSLIKMTEEKKKLSSAVTMQENTKGGISPAFQSSGFIKPDCVDLIKEGTYHHSLISPRSSKEYKVDHNGANSQEMPESFSLLPGALNNSNILKELDTGLYINNTWYLNYSDLTACRITGMTRFATFWVENGKIQAPVNVMRFDETIYNMLGDNLLGLTKDREFIPSSDTYGSRSTASSNLPGALIDNFTFTL